MPGLLDVLKKIAIAMVAGACMAAAALSQVTLTGAKLSTADQAGLLYASNFGQWQVPAGNLGQYSWNNGSYCMPTVGSVYPGITINAFTVGTPVEIVDIDTPIHNEIVTPTAVTISWVGTDPVSCSISITPVYGHNHFYFISATGGLQEAINWAGTTPYQVIVTPDWSLLGGITSTITSATGNANVTILDDRTACSIAYLWSGSAYAAQNSSCSGGGGGGVTQITAGNNITISPIGGTGVVTINASGSTISVNGATVPSPNLNHTSPAAQSGYVNGTWQVNGQQVSVEVPISGIGSIVSGANVVFTGDSAMVDDSGNTLGAAVTATAASCTSGGLCTVTAPNAFTANQWVDFGASFSPICLRNGPTGNGYYGTGTQLFQVLSSGSSSSQFEIQTSCTGVSGTGGTVEDATYFLPIVTTSEPAFANVNAFYLRNGVDVAGIYGGYTGLVAEQATNFNAMYGSLLPSVTGKPLYFLEEGGVNDQCNGESVSAIEGYFQSFWAQAHAAGAYVVQNLIPAYRGCFGSAASPLTLNTWLEAQGKSTSNASSGQYWDYAGVDMEAFGLMSNPFPASNIALMSQAWGAAVSAPGTSGFTLTACNSESNCAPLIDPIFPGYIETTGDVLVGYIFDGTGMMTLSANYAGGYIDTYGGGYLYLEGTAPTGSCSSMGWVLSKDGKQSYCNGTTWTQPFGGGGSIPSQYKTWSCEPGLGDGTNAITGGTYHKTTCYNQSGVTWTITAINCYTNNSGTSTIAVTDGTNNLLSTSTLVCSPSPATGAVSSSHYTIASGGSIVFTFAADGTSAQTTWIVGGTY
jgi:hypothetical protein